MCSRSIGPGVGRHRHHDRARRAARRPRRSRCRASARRRPPRSQPRRTARRVHRRDRPTPSHEVATPSTNSGVAPGPRTPRPTPAARSRPGTVPRPTAATHPPAHESSRPEQPRARALSDHGPMAHDRSHQSDGLPLRPLGSSGPEVSVMSLGSWRTYERIPREQGLAVMRAARDAGITFLDDARYDDETGDAPIPTGYSEVVFGELFRAAGWARDEVVGRQQAVVGVLAGAVGAAGARRLARPDGPRPRRPDLRDPPARAPPDGRARRAGRRT